MIFTPDDFRDDWYGFATNQISHIGLGVVSAWLFAAGVFALYDEYPIKTGAWMLLALTYGAYELGIQNWRRWDTIEDFLFVVVYGGGGAFAGFSETAQGVRALSFDPYAPLPFFLCACAHLALGVGVRWFRRARS